MKKKWKENTHKIHKINDAKNTKSTLLQVTTIKNWMLHLNRYKIDQPI